jgi:spore coat polysaccharide biosynthesis protein SpsF
MSFNREWFDNSFNTTAIIQARMGSTRLPGKILRPLAGKPALWHVVNRLGYSQHLKDIIIATTVNSEDDAVIEFCNENGIKWFRGSDDDVLDRYYRAARTFGADPIVRITADCPVIDPTIVDEVIKEFFEEDYDVYGLGGEFPDGLDCSMFAYRVLEDTWKNAKLPSEREHVGPYMKKHPEKYKTGAYEKFSGLARHRWTLDEEADLRFLEAVFERLYKEGEIFLTRNILDLLETEPRIMEINSGITRNEGYLKSLAEDERYLQGSKL